jgi:hypothetical protein
MWIFAWIGHVIGFEFFAGSPTWWSFPFLLTALLSIVSEAFLYPVLYDRLFGHQE